MAEAITQGEHYFSIDGLRVHVRCAGEGKSLLLVHGLGGPLMWQRLIHPLSAFFRVLAVDLPGFGESACPPQRLSTGAHARFLLRLLDTVDIKNAIVAGVSYGGQIAVEFAAQYPERAEALVLMSSTGLAPRAGVIALPPLWPALSILIKHTVLRSRQLMCFLGGLSFYDTKLRPDDLCKNFFRQLSQPGCRDAWLNMLRNIYARDAGFPEKLSGIQTPALLLWGEEDHTVPLRLARKFQQRIPEAVLKTFPRCAHSIPLEKPEEVCNAITDFVKKR